jgi:crossover junction endodeoxyribonuclease RuvC
MVDGAPGKLSHGERILGIDPGLKVTGYACLEVARAGPRVIEAGIVDSSQGGSKALATRIAYLYDSIVELIGQLTPGIVVVEQLYAHYQHPRTAILMAHARGVIFLAAAKAGLPLISYNATRIKKTVTGNGRAPKDQVQRTVQRELGLDRLPSPADVADALAAALCHYHAQVLPEHS